MSKLIMMALLLASMSGVAQADGNSVCLKHVELPIHASAPHFTVGRSVERRNKILLQIVVDCKDDAVIVPSSSDEAEQWLDLALPLDFKSGITGGDHVNAYAYTTYAENVENDLYHFFTDQWNLKPDSNVCKNLPLKPYMEKGENWCFNQLLDKLRDAYKNPVRLTP